MRTRALALCVLIAGSALAVATTAPAQGPEPFDLFVLKVDSAFLAKDGPHTRTALGGSFRVRRVYVRNLGPGDAPQTRIGFRWKRSGTNVASVSVGGMGAAEQRRSGTQTVPFPVRNGRYRLWVCANMPPVEEREGRRANNCSRVGRTIIVDREVGLPSPLLLQISPTSHDFGTLPAGVTSDPQNFTVSNSGTGSTEAGQAFVQGTGATAFQVLTNGCAGGFRGVGSCRVSVTFAATAPGTYNAELVVRFGDQSGDPFVRAQLSGTAG